MKLKATVVDAEDQLDDSQVPRTANVKLGLDHLQYFAGEEGHVPGAVELDGRADDKDEGEGVVFVVVRHQSVVHALQIGGKRRHVEFAIGKGHRRADAEGILFEVGQGSAVVPLDGSMGETTSIWAGGSGDRSGPLGRCHGELKLN